MAVNAKSQALKPQTYPSLKSIDDYHRNMQEIIKQYFALVVKGQILTSGNNLFVGATSQEIQKITDELLAEEEIRSCFALLSHIEATFKAHFLYVVDKGIKCKQQNAFLNLFKSRTKKNTPKSPEIVSRISLKSEILQEWKNCGEMNLQTYNGIIGAFDFRNWFAHGRFLTLKPLSATGVSYRYDDLYLFAEKADNLCALAKPYLS